MYRIATVVNSTGAALLENNEASAKLPLQMAERLLEFS